MSTKNVVRLAKEFVIKVHGMVIARCTDFSFSINRETIDITSFDTKGWVEKMSDNKDWSISFSSMVTRDVASGDPGFAHGLSDVGSGTYENLLDLMLSGTADHPVTICLSTGTASFIEGPGILQSLDVDGSVGDKATYSGSIEGAGAITRPS